MFLCKLKSSRCRPNSGIEIQILSHPCDPPTPKFKTTLTVVGLRLINRWEPPPTHHRNSKQQDRAEIENNLKTKVISLYKETKKQFLNPTPTPKIAH